MRTSDLLTEAFGRVPDGARRVVDGLTAEQLVHRPGGLGNSVAWLLWHLTRVQDSHVAEVAGTQQRWTAGGWVDRFALPLDRDDTGYGHDDEQVAAVRVEDGRLLTAYLDDVHQHTLALVQGLSDGDLDRVVDDSWDPPVTLGVRLVSVVDDDLEHLGQAAYVRGLLDG